MDLVKPILIGIAGCAVGEILAVPAIAAAEPIRFEPSLVILWGLIGLGAVVGGGLAAHLYDPRSGGGRSPRLTAGLLGPVLYGLFNAVMMNPDVVTWPWQARALHVGVPLLGALLGIAVLTPLLERRR